MLSNKPQKDINNYWHTKTSYGDLKKAVAEAVEAFLTAFQVKYQQIDAQLIDQKLAVSEEAMRKVADKQLYKVQQAVGLRPA